MGGCRQTDRVIDVGRERNDGVFIGRIREFGELRFKVVRYAERICDFQDGIVERHAVAANTGKTNT